MSGVEILGLAASVIQIAELGGKLSVSLFTFTRKVKNANKTIDALSQEIAVTGAVLQQLGETLSNDKSVKVCSQEAIDTAKKLVLDTEKVFRNLENLLDVQDKPNSRFRKAVNLKRLKFPFLESEIEQVQANLERLKSSLLVILNVLIFAEQLRNRETLPILEDQRELIRILAAEKDENEQRYERILKAIADRPKPQSDGQSDTSSLHSNTLTLVDHGDSTSHHSTGLAKPTGDKVDGLPAIDLPDGLKLHYERICHHTYLVQNLLSEIDSLDYKLDHSTRGRMHNGVLDVHWNEWNSQRRLYGVGPFEKILHNSAEIATYWADKVIDEQLQATQGKPKIENAASGNPTTDISQSIQEQVDLAKKLMTENIENVLERGERLDQLTAKRDDLVISAQSFRTKAEAQNHTWYNLLSTPVVWVGGALGAIGSIPTRLWLGQSSSVSESPVPKPIEFVYEVYEDRIARQRLLAATTGKKISSLPEDEIQGFTAFRDQMEHPEFTINECSKEQVLLFKAVFDDFDKEGLGRVPLEQLGDMIRRLGYNPNNRVLNAWCLEAGMNEGDALTFEKYIGFMLRATEELKEISIDTPWLNPSTNQPVPALADNGTANESSGDQQTQKHSVNDLTEDQREELKEVFQLFDKDGSGVLKVTELGTIMRSLGQNPTEAEVQDLLNQADVTEKDKITVDDFFKLMAPTLIEEADDSIRAAFKVFDKDASGTITIAELNAVMRSLGEIQTEAEIQNLISKAGLTGKTELTYDELSGLLAPTDGETEKFGISNQEASKLDNNQDNIEAIKARLSNEGIDEMMLETDKRNEVISFDTFGDLISNDDLQLDLGEEVLKNDTESSSIELTDNNPKAPSKISEATSTVREPLRARMVNMYGELERSEQAHGGSPMRVPPPPPRPMNTNQYQGQGMRYNSMGRGQNSFLPPSLPPPPPPRDNVLLVPTFIPGGESFGPGISIPPLEDFSTFSYEPYNPEASLDRPMSRNEESSIRRPPGDPAMTTGAPNDDSEDTEDPALQKLPDTRVSTGRRHVDQKPKQSVPEPTTALDEVDALILRFSNIDSDELIGFGHPHDSATGLGSERTARVSVGGYGDGDGDVVSFADLESAKRDEFDHDHDHDHNHRVDELVAGLNSY